MIHPDDKARAIRTKHRKEQVRKGLHCRGTAKYLRALADSNALSDPTGARFDRRYADDHDETANGLLSLQEIPAQGTGGELELLPSDANELPGLIDTAAEPDLVTARASLERLNLAAEAGCLETAADAAESISAKNSLERMLAHQMAAAHKLAMTFTQRALIHAHSSEYAHLSIDARTTHSIEAARMAGAASRMMSAFNDGLRTLERLRNGGRQVVVVQHVNVNDGGQALVTGTVEAKAKGGGDGRL